MLLKMLSVPLNYCYGIDELFKIDDVHYQMLMSEAKKSRLKPEALVEELIQVQYNQRK